MRRAGRDRSAETDLRKDALQRCGALLASRDYSEAKLREKLRGDEYPEDVIDGVIGELKEAHYVDDARIAGQYVRLHLADRSVERIKQDLYRMGIDREIAEDALREAAEEIDPQAAQEEQQPGKKEGKCRLFFTGRDTPLTSSVTSLTHIYYLIKIGLLWFLH